METIDDALTRGTNLFLSIAVRIAVRSPDPAHFLAWAREYGGALLVEHLGFPSDAAGSAALGMVVGSALWNHLPHPDHGYRPIPLPEPGRNDPCPCGSGQKFKRCCGSLPIPPLEIDQAALLPHLLGMLSLAELKTLPHKRFDPELLAQVAGDWIDEGGQKRAIALLEPLFAPGANPDARHGLAFDTLMNAYLDLDMPRKRKLLLDGVLASSDAALRGDGWQRLATQHADNGDYAAAWEAFRQAQRCKPGDPGLALLEVTLLSSEGRVGELGDRARFWLAAMERRPDRDDLGEVRRLLHEAAEQPEAMAGRWMGITDPDLARLAELLGAAPAPRPVKLERVEDGAVWPKQATRALDSALDALAEGRLGALVEVLERRPALLDEPRVLLALDDLLYDLDLPPGWTDDVLCGPLYARAAALLDSSLGVAGAGLKFEWGWMENRPLLSVLARRADWLGRDAPEAGVDACTRLLELSPGDNLGMRYLLADQLARLGRYAELLALSEAHAGEAGSLAFDRALALHALGRKGEALAALAEAHRAGPLFLPFLLPERRREPAPDGPGIVMGGEREAWEYRAARREAWLATGALELARAFAGASGRKR